MEIGWRTARNRLSRVSLESDTGQVFFFRHKIMRLFWLIDVPRNRRATRRNEKSWPKPSPKTNTDEQTGWEYSGENDNYVDRKMTSPARKPHTVLVADITCCAYYTAEYQRIQSKKNTVGFEFDVRTSALRSVRIADGGDGISLQAPKLRCPLLLNHEKRISFFLLIF